MVNQQVLERDGIVKGQAGGVGLIVAGKGTHDVGIKLSVNAAAAVNAACTSTYYSVRTTAVL